jgi:hypothetical protein
MRHREAEARREQRGRDRPASSPPGHWPPSRTSASQRVRVSDEGPRAKGRHGEQPSDDVPRHAGDQERADERELARPRSGSARTATRTRAR